MKSRILGVILLGIPGSVLLAWISNRFLGFAGWWGFLIDLLLGMVLLILSWKIVRRDNGLTIPSWMGWAMLASIALRLMAAILWYTALPILGYGSPVEQSGYIMADAHARDIAAWELARSEKPLSQAFSEYNTADQYGGMLFLSALNYRYLGGGTHQPLQVVTITAFFSSLAVLFTWAFTRRAFNDQAARLAAWTVVVYPDAVILGSSQMREGFLVTLVALACYGMARFLKDRSWSGLGLVFCGLALVLPFSPPVGGVLLVVLLTLALFMEGWAVLRRKRFWLVVGGVAFVAGIGIWIAWGRIAPEGITNPVALLGWWFTQSARWQAYFARRSSWLIKRIFNATPEWTHVLILMAYGVFQPFLPAAVMDSGAPIWKGIAIWRAAGWTILLAFLLAAPGMALWQGKKQKTIIGISLAVWSVVLVAAIRSGGDMWDNPRYRLVFLSLQATLAAWAWIDHRQRNSQLLSRAAAALAILLVWFIPWYLQRYGIIRWPVSDVFGTLGLGLLTVFLFFSWKYLWKKFVR
jgi:hypothetical protein